jgi:hypothetical protein
MLSSSPLLDLNLIAPHEQVGTIVVLQAGPLDVRPRSLTGVTRPGVHPPSRQTRPSRRRQAHVGRGLASLTLTGLPGGPAADTLAPRCFWEDAARLADALGPAARRDLLRVLTSPSDVRADVIRQLHKRPDGQEMADLLIFLEEWEWARQGMIEELSRA